MKVARTPSALHKDYIASCLRSQISDLQDVLQYIENHEKHDKNYVGESLERIRRKFFQYKNIFSN